MTVDSVRRYLPKKLKNLSDEDVSSLLTQLEILAEILIETYDAAGSKKQLGVIDRKERRLENEDSN